MSTHPDLPDLVQQVSDLREAVLAMATALGAALPHTPEVLAALRTIADQQSGQDT